MERREERVMELGAGSVANSPRTVEQWGYWSWLKWVWAGFLQVLEIGERCPAG